MEEDMNLPTEYQSFIHLSRYARWDYSETRRETWEETVDRYFNFFKDHLKEHCDYEVEEKELKELRKAGFYKSTEKTLRRNTIYGTQLGCFAAFIALVLFP